MQSSTSHSAFAGRASAHDDQDSSLLGLFRIQPIACKVHSITSTQGIGPSLNRPRAVPPGLPP